MKLLIDGSNDAPVTLLLAHGAGAGMGSFPAIAWALAHARLRVVRFEFDYMATRREGHRRPWARAEALVPVYEAAVAALHARTPLSWQRDGGLRLDHLLLSLALAPRLADAGVDRSARGHEGASSDGTSINRHS